MENRATSVRAHQYSVDAQENDGESQAIGRSRGGLTTKIHPIVDALGNVVVLSLTLGQAADIMHAIPLLDRVAPGAFLADEGCNSDVLVATLEGGASHPSFLPKQLARIAPSQMSATELTLGDRDRIRA